MNQRISNTIRYLSVIVIVAMTSTGLYASDLEKEKRWAEQVVDAIIDGEEVWLNDGASDFLGIYTETEGDVKGAVIVMHGTGVHPDWQQVVQPLRVGLIDYGWHTLSIQMPILHNEAEHIEYAPLYEEVTPRINAAIDFLKEKKINNIVIVAHSQGAAMAAYHLSRHSENVKGFVAIGAAVSDADARMDSIGLFEKIQLPLLDLYGDEDLEMIMLTAKKRQQAAEKAGNKNFTQRVIKGNHFYDDNEDQLVEAVAEWLQALN